MGSLYTSQSPEGFRYSQQHHHHQATSFGRALFMDGRAEDEQLPYQATLTDDPSFDIIEWHPAYQSCQRYFLDHSQYEPGTQALCSLINIRLPFQWNTVPPITSSSLQSPASSTANPSMSYTAPFTRSGNVSSPSRLRTASRTSAAYVSLVSYIRRLVVTGFDKPGILHGLFGDDYARGVLPHVDCERRNYLFAAKSGGWRSCKKMYDAGSGGGGDESVPFLKPLDDAKIEEVTAAEKAWSSWLAMEDWMIGPRAFSDGRTTAEQNSSNGETINGATHDIVI